MYAAWTIAVILLILWLLGFSFDVGGGLIHLVLVIVVIVVIIRLVTGRGGIDSSLRVTTLRYLVPFALAERIDLCRS